jgi:hypothetical protein
MTPGRHRARRRQLPWPPAAWVVPGMFIVGLISCVTALTCLTVMSAGII